MAGILAKGHRRWLLLGALAAVLVVGVVAVLVCFPEPEYPYTVSRETTYFLGPLNPDGTVNYVAALNEIHGRGVTPENNAAVLLLQAIGPSFLDERCREETLRVMGASGLPEDGEYFVTLADYLEANLSNAGASPPAADAADKGGQGAPADKGSSKTLRKVMDAYHEKTLSAPWSARDYPAVADWLEANRKPLALAVAASERPRYYVPLVSTTTPASLVQAPGPSLRHCRAITQALASRAMLRLGRDDVEGSWSDLVACYRLGRLLAHGPTLLHKVVGASCDWQACAGGEALALSGRPNSRQAKKFLADLQSLPALPGLLNTVHQYERLALLDVVGTMYRQQMNSRRKVAIDWDHAMRVINSWFDRQIAAMHKGTFAERKAAMDDLESARDQLEVELGLRSTRKRPRWLRELFGERKGKSWQEAYPSSPGEALVVACMSSLHRVQELHDRATMHSQLAQVAFSLAAYKAEWRKYPDALSELTPKYIESVPEDLFVNQPLKYQRTDNGYVLYSVGPDMKDDGGKPDDLVVRTPAPKPNDGPATREVEGD